MFNCLRYPSTLTAQLALISGLLFTGLSVQALDRPDTEFKIFQFPADQIPRIDGDASDWDIVPESYVIGTDELWETSGKHDEPNPETLDIRVRVGWVEGLNRLYFLYEAYDDYWDFSLPGLKNDTFEIVVDGDLSGGPLIARFRNNPESISEEDAFFSMHGVHAQNYHIFTPHEEKDWAMLWGPQQWLKELPYAQVAQSYDFRPGESGHYTLEFYITPFDFASAKGPEHSVETDLKEGKLIGLSWAIIDYDDVDSSRNNGFWTLSRTHIMYGQANHLVGFRLMPLEPEFIEEGLKAHWSFNIVDMERRLVAFKDQSVGEVDSWHWDFGDGNSSDEQHPIHEYAEGGNYVVVLKVEGPEGSSRFSRVWDVGLH
ncbi:MAG: PKD domain-containing protein [Opitutales bacterium]|nr:PKD domain-containing protein [Opitutales bacterium]